MERESYRKPKTVTPLNWLVERGIGVHTYQFLLNLGRYRPSIIPSITKFMFNVLHSKPIPVVDDSYKVFMFDCLFPQYVNEWAIPWELAPQALRDLDHFINTSGLAYSCRNSLCGPIQLSSCYSRKTCYVGVIMYRPYGNPVPYKQYWKAYEDIMREYEGRSHWAKAHGQTTAQLEASYPKF